MPLLKYSELTEEQKKLVSVMYSDLTDQEQYLYNFDGDKYSGRHPYIPGTPYGTERKEDSFDTGTVYAEPLVEETKEVEVKGEPEKKNKVKSIRSRKK